MATRYTILSNGSPLLDVTGSTVAYNSAGMDSGLAFADVYVEFLTTTDHLSILPVDKSLFMDCQPVQPGYRHMDHR